MAWQATFRARKLPEAASGQSNVEHFLGASVRDWFLTCGEIQLTRAGDGKDEALWEEDAHNDGAGSVLHMGVTLWGRRAVRFEQGEGNDREQPPNPDRGTYWFLIPRIRTQAQGLMFGIAFWGRNYRATRPCPRLGPGASTRALPLIRPGAGAREGASVRTYVRGRVLPGPGRRTGAWSRTGARPAAAYAMGAWCFLPL